MNAHDSDYNDNVDDETTENIGVVGGDCHHASGVHLVVDRVMLSMPCE